MEKVIKIQSDNSFVQTFDNDNALPPTQKLLNFTIPRGEVYDLSRSYISINIEPNLTNNGALDGHTPIVRTFAFLQTNGTRAESHKVRNECLIRNAQMYSQNRGMLENIQSFSTLAVSKLALENDEMEAMRNLDQLGTTESDIRPLELPDYFCDQVRVSTGTNDITTETSRVLSVDKKIHLKDVFGICKSNAYDGDAYGDTTIHLELHLDKLFMDTDQGSEATQLINSGALNADDMDNQNGIVNGTAITTVTTQYTLENPQQQGVYFVGQKVTVAGTGSNGGRATSVACIITKAEYSATSKKMTYTFSRTVFTASSAPENWTAITVIADTGANSQVRINGAEIVLVGLKDPKNVPDKHDYITYTTEEFVGNSLATVNKQLKVEGNAQSVYICSCDTGEIAPDRAITSYRLAIDNVDVSGNRDIKFDSGLYKDRIIRAYRNKGVELKDIRSRLNKMSLLQTTRNDEPNAVIVETMPLQEQEKSVNLSLTNTANCQDVKVYKEVIRTM